MSLEIQGLRKIEGYHLHTETGLSLPGEPKQLSCLG